MATGTTYWPGKPDQSPGHARNAVPDVYRSMAFNMHLHVEVRLGTMRYCCLQHWPWVVPDQQGSYIALPERLTD